MRRINLASSFAISLICIGITVAIAVQPTVREGLELLFLLPLSYAISLVLFGDLYLNWKDNVGTALILISSLLRYVITPLLMSLSHHSVAYINAQSSSYRVSIFVMIYELYMVLIVWKIVKGKFSKRQHLVNKGRIDESEDSFRVTWLGFIFCCFVILMLIYRGNLQNVFSHFSFLTTYSVDTSDVYTYDRTFVYLLKSFLFIAIASKMGRVAKQNKSLRGICLLVAIAAALLNIAFYDHTSRSILVEFIVSSLFVLMYCFPEKKRMLISVFSIAGFMLVSTVFLFGTLQSTWATLGGSSNMFERISEMGELYANGVSTIAHAIETYPTAHNALNIGNLIGEILKSLGFITFPGFRSIYYAFANTPTAASYFMSSLLGKGFILPPIGFALYYGDIFYAYHLA